MSAAAIKAGKAYVELAIKENARAELATFKGKLMSWGSSLAGAAAPLAVALAAVGAGVAASVKKFMDFGSAINDMSARTGVAATDLQHLQFAAEQTGASASELEAGMRAMARGGFDVAKFEQIGESIAAIEDPTERAAKAMEVFGKSGTKLLPMFAEMKSLRAASEALGPILTADEVKMADELGDAFGALGEALKRAMLQIGAPFGPILKQGLDLAIGLVVKFTQLIKDLRNANPFGSGGDWLDKMSEFLNTPIEDVLKTGSAATAGFGKKPGARPFAGDEDDDASDATRRGVSNEQKMWEAIRDAHQRRNDLIREFETPAENFLRRQNQIIEAIKALNRNRVLGFINPQDAQAQRQGLDQSLGRLRQQEADRLRQLQPNLPNMKEAAAPLITSQSTGTFNAAAANILGRDTAAPSKETAKNTAQALIVQRAMERHLERLARMELRASR